MCLNNTYAPRCISVSVPNSLVWSWFATCSERGYSAEYLQKSPETAAAKERQAKGEERTREGLTCGRDSQAKAGKVNVVEGDK